MGKIDIEKALNSVHFFTLGACQNSNTIRYNSCGGSTLVDAARCDTTAIFKYTANTIATWENCFADSSSSSDSDFHSWNATWMGSEQEVLSSSPRRFAWLALFVQKSCLVVFKRNMTLNVRPFKASSSESFIIRENVLNKGNVLS